MQYIMHLVHDAFELLGGGITYYMGIIMCMCTSAALGRGPPMLMWVLLPLNQLFSSLDAGCTGLPLWILMASLPRNMAFPPKLVEVRLLLKLPSNSLGSGPDPKEKAEAEAEAEAESEAEADIGLGYYVWGSKGGL